MELDRESHSPAPKANGGTDRHSDGRDKEHDSLKVPGDGDYAPRSPSKRKDTEVEMSAESERAEKRARLSEDEEGELVED
jgi:hypothetical protein